MADEDYGDDYNPSDFYEPDEEEFQGLYRIDGYFSAAQADLTALFANTTPRTSTSSSSSKSASKNHNTTGLPTTRPSAS